MKIQYKEKKFRAASLELIDHANVIIDEYRGQGFSLTLRQLYYQMVARDIVENSMKSYKRLGNIISNARLAGLVSWDAIEDRTRNLKKLPSWDKPQDIIKSAISQYRVDMWRDQEYRPEVWIEKDALTGVIAPICQQYDIPYFSCRGYTSMSEMWRAGHHRAKWHISGEQTPVIFHLGDHDPSGIDMTRDIVERLEMFSENPVEVTRLALNINQIEHYNPPPNPAKLTDTRVTEYIRMYGTSSWELDALSPSVLAELIENNVRRMINFTKWRDSEKKIAEGKEWLRQLPT